MKSILEKLIIDKNATVVAGVSGGADSMVLLFVLKEKQKESGFNLVCVHVNHNIRKGESERDQKFVENYCKKNNINYVVYSVDCPKEQEKTKQSMEEVARNLRYSCFNKELKKYKNGILALAHNKDDNAETIFMNICRGSGAMGAMGIKEQNGIIRPLIDLTKAEIKDIAKKNKIDYVEDSTNKDINYTRNYVRNKIFPEVEKIFPAFKDAFINFANNLKEDNEYFNSVFPKESVAFKQNSIEIDKKALKLPKPIAVRIVKYALDKKNWSKDFYKEHYNSICELVNFKNGTKIDLPLKKQAFVEYDKIVITIKENEKNSEVVDFKIGKIKILGHEINIKQQPIENVDFEKNSKFLDLDKIPQNAVIRTRQNGDIFKKLGAGSKKLNDYFTDKKIPLRERNNILLLAYDYNVLMVFGYDISEQVKISDTTENVVEISFK